jgi:hypothetical protein
VALIVFGFPEGVPEHVGGTLDDPLQIEAFTKLSLQVVSLIPPTFKEAVQTFEKAVM